MSYTTEALLIELDVLACKYHVDKEYPNLSQSEGVLRALAASGDDDARRVIALAEAWYGTEVPRNKIKVFTSHVVAAGTIANHDSKHTGPHGKGKCEGKVVYEKWPLTFWLYLRYSSKYRTTNRGIDKYNARRKIDK